MPSPAAAASAAAEAARPNLLRYEGNTHRGRLCVLFYYGLISGRNERVLHDSDAFGCVCYLKLTCAAQICTTRAAESASWRMTVRGLCASFWVAGRSFTADDTSKRDEERGKVSCDYRSG